MRVPADITGPGAPGNFSPIVAEGQVCGCVPVRGGAV